MNTLSEGAIARLMAHPQCKKGEGRPYKYLPPFYCFTVYMLYLVHSRSPLVFRPPLTCWMGDISYAPSTDFPVRSLFRLDDTDQSSSAVITSLPPISGLPRVWTRSIILYVSILPGGGCPVAAPVVSFSHLAIESLGTASSSRSPLLINNRHLLHITQCNSSTSRRRTLEERRNRCKNR